MRFFINFFLILFLSLGVSYASNIKKNNIMFYNPIIKFVKSNHKVTSGYLTIENIGEKDLILKSISTNISEISEIHTMEVVNDIVKMKKVKKPILIPKKKKIIFKPGGLHIMFANLKKNLTLQERETVIFEFKNLEKIKILMTVKNIGMKKKHKH